MSTHQNPILPRNPISWPHAYLGLVIRNARMDHKWDLPTCSKKLAAENIGIGEGILRLVEVGERAVEDPLLDSILLALDADLSEANRWREEIRGRRTSSPDETSEGYWIVERNGEPPLPFPTKELAQAFIGARLKFVPWAQIGGQ